MHGNLEIIKKTTKVLENGGVILYPTDTIWGIGCDATNKDAIRKVYAIKKRQQEKPLIILIHDSTMLKKYIHAVPEIAYKIIHTETEPITIIYNNPIKLPKILINNNTIGIRVVKNPDVNKLLEKFKKPITSTSANISEFKTPKTFSEIDDYIKNNVDYIVPETFITKSDIRKSSKIIKIKSDSTIQIIRN